jgi:hypothetical protein
MDERLLEGGWMKRLIVGFSLRGVCIYYIGLYSMAYYTV